MTLQLFSIHHPNLKNPGQVSASISLKTWQQETLPLSAPGTHWGYVFEGECQLFRGDRPTASPFPLAAGMYFCLPEAGLLDGRNSAGFIVTCPDHHGMFSVGGPIEAIGRLAYINGGTNTVLIPPPVLGDPCLNAMYLPPDIQQTMHTHPSCRIGLVISGSGTVETPEETDAIAPGDLFIIPAHQAHRFCTEALGLAAVVFHPDSEAGFSHRDNPMLRRTFVEGVSAVALPDLQTPILKVQDGSAAT